MKFSGNAYLRRFGLSVLVFVSTACASASPVGSATIDAESGVLTMVNVITPQPGKQEETIAALQSGMDEEMSAQPGFISSTIHRSLDSEHVVVYAQWADQASVAKAVSVIESGGAPNMASVFTTATPDFHPYQVVSVHPAGD